MKTSPTDRKTLLIVAIIGFSGSLAVLGLLGTDPQVVARDKRSRLRRRWRLINRNVGTRGRREAAGIFIRAASSRVASTSGRGNYFNVRRVGRAAGRGIQCVGGPRLDHRFDLAISIRDAGRCTVLDAASKAVGNDTYVFYAHAAGAARAGSPARAHASRRTRPRPPPPPLRPGVYRCTVLCT